MTMSKVEVLAKVLAKRIEQRLDQSGLAPGDANATGRFRAHWYPPENPTAGNGWIAIENVKAQSKNYGTFDASVSAWLLYPATSNDFVNEAIYRTLDPTYDFSLYRAFETRSFVNDEAYVLPNTTTPKPQFAALQGWDNAADSYDSLVVDGQSVEGTLSVSVKDLSNAQLEMVSGSYYVAVVTEMSVYFSP